MRKSAYVGVYQLLTLTIVLISVILYVMSWLHSHLGQSFSWLQSVSI